MTFQPLKVGEPANNLLRLNYLFNKADLEVRDPAALTWKFARMWHNECVKVAGFGVMSPGGTGYFPYGKYSFLGPAVNNAVGNEFENYFTLDAGTYDLVIVANTFDAAAIVEWKVDGVSIGSTDLYSAFEVDRAILTITGVTIPSDGTHTLTILVTGKNASSTNEVVRLYKYCFREA